MEQRGEEVTRWQHNTEMMGPTPFIALQIEHGGLWKMLLIAYLQKVKFWLINTT